MDKKIILLLTALMLIPPNTTKATNSKIKHPTTYSEEGRKKHRETITQEERKRQKEELEKEIEKARQEKGMIAKDNEEKELHKEWLKIYESTRGLYTFKIGENKYVKKYKEEIEEKEMEIEPFLEKNKTYLPLRYVGEALGILVKYDNDTRTVTLYNGIKDITVKINIDNGYTTKNGKREDIEKPIIKGGRTVLPVGDISLLFELTKGNISDGVAHQVEWDNKEKAVYIVNI